MVAPDFGGHDRLLTVAEAVRRLRVSRATVYKLVGEGRLAHVRIGNQIRFLPGAISPGVASLPEEAGTSSPWWSTSITLRTAAAMSLAPLIGWEKTRSGTSDRSLPKHAVATGPGQTVATRTFEPASTSSRSSGREKGVLHPPLEFALRHNWVQPRSEGHVDGCRHRARP